MDLGPHEMQGWVTGGCGYKVVLLHLKEINWHIADKNEHKEPSYLFRHLNAGPKRDQRKCVRYVKFHARLWWWENPSSLP